MKTFRKIFFSIIILCLLISTRGFSRNWESMKSIEELYLYYPNTINSLFNSLNLDYIGLEEVKKAYNNGDTILACRKLLDYYSNSKTRDYLKTKQATSIFDVTESADSVINNIFNVQLIRGKVPYLSNGHRDWEYNGPYNAPEWSWLSNRHEQLVTVYSKYLETGDLKYITYIDLFLKDFIISSLPYPAKHSSGAIWRGLEVSFRAKRWPIIFYGLIDDKNLSDASKLLILSSLKDHAHYNKNFHAQNNWLSMEMAGLASVGAYFPEYKMANEWLDYSIKTIEKSISGQIYEDGAQIELTAHYHAVVIENFQIIKDICDFTGKNNSLSKNYISTLYLMNEYLAKIIRPDGSTPLNNDGDRVNARPMVLTAAKSFNMPEWEYIATDGKKGKKPSSYSFLFPWSGHLISREGYSIDSHWSFFDIGPWGAAHEHSDKLHISISAYGRDLLVDGGRFAYDGDIARKYRRYAISSRSHNTIMIDNKGQLPGPAIAETPISTNDWEICNEFDYAIGSFNAYEGLEGEAKHTRMLYYKRGEMWIVVDQITSDRPRDITAMWHFHPDCKVEYNNNIVYTNNSRGNLTILPVGNKDWSLNLIKGQDTPYIQGYYSREYNSIEKNTVAEYTTTVNPSEKIIWLIYPSKNAVTNIKARLVLENDTSMEIEITNPRGKKSIITIPNKF